jgi:hypothetical protein
LSLDLALSINNKQTRYCRVIAALLIHNKQPDFRVVLATAETQIFLAHYPSLGPTRPVVFFRDKGKTKHFVRLKTVGAPITSLFCRGTQCM